MISAGEYRVRDLRLDRRVLRAEHARVMWWRRLVRARLDLAVAQVARPDPLGEEIAFQLPPQVGVDVPRPAALAAMLGPGAGAGSLRIDELRTLDAQLARYGEGVEAALAEATERLISRLAQEPGATLSGFVELPNPS
ncbi:hypothetical protein [Cellulomonas sp. URHE0023]|uniref:hypothetical protein n=1 Tax=Cellulomonas sp. URHE0023 TaxID=1380354 RepID=UPI0004860CC7|nr:hypothetical protein [Cellulomonas sp. URHE0023]